MLESDRVAPAEKDLTHSLFHRLMELFYIPARWSDLEVGLATLMLAGLAAAAWLLFSQAFSLFVYALGLQLLFFTADYAVLVLRPRLRISFSGWKGQFFPLILPRAAATALVAPLGIWMGWPNAFALLVVIQTLGSAALLYGALHEPRRVGLSELKIATDRMAPGTRPIRILHISDLHIERLSIREEQLLAIVDRVKPDVIVITGDYANLSFNLDPVTHEQIRQYLSQLTAPYGVYATLGSPPVDLPELVSAVFTDTSIILLRDKWQQVDLGQGRGLVLMGLDCRHDIPTDSHRLAKLVTAAPRGMPQVLLYHSPELMPQAVAAGIDLYLCGHTHGGQVRLPIIGPVLTMSALGRRYVMGHYHEGNTHLYVSRGVGFEGLSAPRVRFLCPPEVLLITIEPVGK